MTSPFDSWNYRAMFPNSPETWKRDYYDRPHVKECELAITHWQEGLLTMRELFWRIGDAYSKGYESGQETAHYPVPAIPIHVEILPTSVFVYERPDEMTERITYLSLRSGSSSIWE